MNTNNLTQSRSELTEIVRSGRVRGEIVIVPSRVAESFHEISNNAKLDIGFPVANAFKIMKTAIELSQQGKVVPRSSAPNIISEKYIRDFFIADGFSNPDVLEYVASVYRLSFGDYHE